MRKTRAGKLRCTKGAHYMPVSEFAVKTNGRLQSWCRQCKRSYDARCVAMKRAIAKV